MLSSQKGDMKSTSSETRPSTAIVVDDDLTQRTLLTELLRKEGLEVLDFGSAEEALAAMGRGRTPDLVITDIYMPDIDGWRFCRLLRSPEYQAFNEVPIMVVSATFSGIEPSRIAADLGANAFIPSPVNSKLLMEQVRMLLEGGQQISKPQVLIVEDSIAMAGLLKQSFETHGYAADAFSTVAEALRAGQKNSYDVAVLDYHLPDGKGDELLASLQKDQPDCACIMMTTDSGPDLALSFMRKGAAAFLRKPFEPAYLIELCARTRKERALLRVEDLLEERTRELRESEARYRRLVENMNDAIYTLKQDGTIDYVSPPLEKILGYPPEKLVGKAYDFLLHPDDKEQIQRQFDDLLEGKTYPSEYRMLARDGSTRWVRTSSSLIMDGRKIAGIQGVLMDITGRKQVEEALRMANERLEMAQLASGTGVWDWDIRTGKIEWTPQMFELFGLDPKSYAASFEAWGAALHPEDREGAAERINQALRDQAPLANEYRVVHPDGQVRWISALGRGTYDDQGHPVRMLGICLDITGRKMAEEALRESKAKLEAVFESMNDAVFISDMNGNFIDFNEAFATYHRFGSKEECYRKLAEYHDYIDVFFADRTLAPTDMWAVPRALRGETVSNAEYILRRKDTGETWWGSYSFGPIRGRDGEIVGSIVVGRDVTEQKKAGDALRKSEERLALATRGTGIGIWDYYPAMDLLEWDDQMFDLFDVPREAFRKTFEDWSSCVATEALPEVLEKFHAALEGEKEFNVEFPVRRRNGEIRYLAGISFVNRDEQGKPVRVVGVNYDITGRKQAEVALREREEWYRVMMEQAADTVIMHDENGLILDANLKACQSLGYSREELLSRTIGDIDPEAIQKGMHKLWDTVLSGESATFESRQKRKDGSELPVEVTLGSVRLPNGKAILGIIRDITERKRAEADKENLQMQLLQAQKMESVGRLAGGVAHDFNNILQSIMGFSEMALEKLERSSPLHGDIKEIHQSASKAADLTRQLLAFARKQTVTPKILDLNDTIAAMLKMIRRLIGEDIDIAWMPGAGLWQVRMDPSQIDQVLANLCVNSRDAITGVGKVTIETENTVFEEAYCKDHSGFIPGDFVQLSVSDNGCGMDKSVLEHIFEPFFTTKGLGKGTGLGLATVYGIVKQNEGFIKIYSEPGTGTTFRIYLPRYGAANGQPEKKPPMEAPRHGTETILLVEDDPAILDMGKRMLKNLGYEVLTASTAKEALEIARKKSGEILLLLTDVVMPGMNGRDLAGKLLSRHPDMKCLFMSGYPSDVIALHGILEEGMRFIEKPFSMKDLASKLREVLES
jgi:two-component system, cell cycle sensor histidine kinase and response regulator CckA